MTSNGTPRRYSAKPYTYDPIPQRDERFTDLWNQGERPRPSCTTRRSRPAIKLLMMLYKRLREIDVPEDDGQHHHPRPRASRGGTTWP